MQLSELKPQIPLKVYEQMEILGRTTLRPSQWKAIKAGLFEDKNLLICTPTASGKTLVAELAFLNSILNGIGKAIYIVPLKALANEKYDEFTKKYGSLFKIAKSIGDTDSEESYLAKYDLIITTSEKLDSLIRHHAPWLREVKTVVVDEIHLLNDTTRGPTLEIVLTILRQVLKNIQLIGLSATIGNPKELSAWLNAQLVEDSWRPVKLHKGIYLDGHVEFFEEKKK
ncbi:MAG TPA: DEAD/DEAH box helicase [Acidobacteriota bacterium]|nr:DEAD/DEAH box helicase [Acidobacteriota bacterium]